MAVTTDDLGHTGRFELSWQSGKILESLNSLFDSITTETESAINWYLKSKLPKRRWATRLRVGSIFFAVVAGLIPILGQIFNKDGKPAIQPAWAAVALGVAAGLVLLDRFFGCSSAWMRYIEAELNLRQLNQEFQMDWETTKATWMGMEPSTDQLRSALVQFKAFVTQVNTIVRQETDAWIQEFQTTLKQIDDASSAKAATNTLGAVNVTVTNGDSCENGWTLTIDQGSATTHRGKTAAVRDLIPGIHTLKISGAIAEKLRQAETAVSVAAGGTAAIETSLQ